jgi:hypothetical protein
MNSKEMEILRELVEHCLTSNNCVLSDFIETNTAVLTRIRDEELTWDSEMIDKNTALSAKG